MSDNLNGEAIGNSGGRMDTDLNGMTPEAALKYVAAFITNLKEVEKSLEQMAKDRALWEERRTLAAKNSRQDLVVIAEDELKKIDERAARYKNEEADLKFKVSILRDEYAKLVSTYDNEIALDKANVLLEQLKAATGDDNPGLKKEFKNIQVDDELDKMKNDLNRNG